jgi:hypothetical protein
MKFCAFNKTHIPRVINFSFYPARWKFRLRFEKFGDPCFISRAYARWIWGWTNRRSRARRDVTKLWFASRMRLFWTICEAREKTLDHLASVYSGCSHLKYGHIGDEEKILSERNPSFNSLRSNKNFNTKCILNPLIMNTGYWKRTGCSMLEKFLRYAEFEQVSKGL